MLNEKWQCHKCGRVGGFILLGGGLVRCPGCGAIHFVAWGGQIHLASFTGVHREEV